MTALFNKWGKTYDLSFVRRDLPLVKTLICLNVMWMHLEQCSFPMTQAQDLFDNSASKIRYEAYSRLQAAAVAFGETLNIPEIVAIGGQSDGKSSLLEAFLGFRFNITSSEMGTRRPLIVQMVHDPSALEPRCRLQDEDSDEYGQVISEAAIAEAIRERTEVHLRKLGATVSSKPIVMRAEFAYAPNLTIVDTPGFILKARKGEADTTPDDIMAMVKAQCAPPHRLILFLQQSSVEWCSSLWMHIIQEVDPHYQRTVMVCSKFDNRLKEFSERWEVDKYLSASGYLPPSVKPFFVALPKDRAGGSGTTSSAEWRKAIQEVDSSVKTHLRESIAGGFDEELFGTRIGFGNLRRFLEEELARRYRDAAPATLALLQERCESVARELLAADRKLQEAGDVVSLRKSAIQYVLAIAGRVEGILEGSPLIDPMQYGWTTEEERSNATGSNWPGVTAVVKPANAGLRLFGGAAFERVLQEFQEAARCLEFPPVQRDRVANLLLVDLLKNKSRNGGGVGKAAEELARGAAREALGPLLDAACARLGAVVKRAFDIAADQAQHQRGTEYERLRPYVAFHAALRSAFQAFVAGLEERCKGIVRHHLETATSEYAMGLLAESATPDDLPSVYDASEGVAPMGADENEPGPLGRAPFAETQQTVPETPSPDVLTVNKPDHLRRAAMAAAAGRNVDEDSPAKGRMAKVARTAGVGAMAPPPATAGSAYLNAARLFGRIRQTVACQAAPATLKSAFLEPVAAQLSAELAVEMCGRKDEDFMGLFTAAGVLSALEASRDALAKRVEGLVRCKNEFQELARCLGPYRPAEVQPLAAAAGGRMASQAPAGRVPPSQISFDTLCRFFERMVGQRQRKSRKKAGGGGGQEAGGFRFKEVQRFIEVVVDKQSHDAFSIFRLMLPSLDNKRGNYHLLEAKLAAICIEAAALEKNSAEAQAVRKWKRPDAKKAGDFAAVLKDSIFDVFCMVQERNDEERKLLKVGDLNAELDKLVEIANSWRDDAGERRRVSKEQGDVMRGLMQKTTATQMKWIVQIILKNLKINCGEGTILKAWHPDAEAVYNNRGMDLQFIFNQMIDPRERVSVTLTLGVAARPQMASPISSTGWAFEKMHRKGEDDERVLRPFVLETKFDGERIQVHRCEDGSFKYFSRKAIEHGEHTSYNVADAMIRQFTTGPCILDGELLVWNKKRGEFEAFGSIKPVIVAIRDRKPADAKLEYNQWDLDSIPAVQDFTWTEPLVGDCELLYVAFDLLHNGRTALTEKPLSERLELLRRAVVPGEPVPLNGSSVCGRVVPLVPGETRFNTALASRYGSTEQDIKDMLNEVHRMKEEGIVIKALDSEWKSNDRHSNWLKLKPDYLRSQEMDCLIIGAFAGEGARSGMYTQYLLALVDSEHPGEFVSFCRVGSGLNQEERKMVDEQLRPIARDASKYPPPACYRLIGREKPEVWISDPTRSIVLQVRADLRTIRSSQFASGYSLRFPRIERIRDDKTASMCNSTADLQAMVEQQVHKQSEEDLFEEGAPGSDKPKRYKRRAGRRDAERAAKKQKKGHQAVASRQLADVSHVEVESDLLAGAKIWFANTKGYNAAELQALVKRLGGKTSISLIPSVTHILAGQDDKSLDRLKRDDRDVICVAWLLQCEREGRLAPLRPRHYLHMSRASLVNNPDVDTLGDSYLSDVEEGDVEHLLGGTVRRGALDLAALAASLAEDADGFDDEEDEVLAEARRRLGRLGKGDAAAAVAAYLDAQLAGIDEGDPRFSLLRGCTATLLQLGTGRADTAAEDAAAAGEEADAPPEDDGAATAAGARRLFPSVAALVQQGHASLERLQQLQAACAGAQVRIMGGSVSGSVGQQVTHVVGLLLAPPTPPATDDSSAEPGAEAAEAEAEAEAEGSTAAAVRGVQPQVLLAAVSQQAGGGTAVASLRLGVSTGGMHLVSQRWVDACMSESQSYGAALQPLPAQGYELPVPGGLEPTATAQWPWDGFISQQRSPKASPRSAARPSRPTSSGDAAARTTVRRGGRAVAGAAPRARPAPAGRASRAGAVKAEPKEESEEEAQGTAVKRETGAPAAAAAAAKPPRRRRPVLTGARRAAPAAEEPAAAPAAVKKEPPPVEVKQEQRQQQQQPRAAAPAPAAAAPAAPPAPAAPAPAAAPPAGGLMFNALFGNLGMAPPAPAAAAAPPPAFPPPPVPASAAAAPAVAPLPPALAAPAGAGNGGAPAEPVGASSRPPSNAPQHPPSMLAAVNPVPATPFQLAPAFAAGQGTVTVGRVEDNVISAIRLNNAAPAQLPDKLINMVSRRHARLEVVAGHLELTDLEAVNGTYVNDARIEKGSRRVLQEGDVVSFGGPTTIVTRGQPRPNPWVWRVRQLQQFLASFVPPSQAPPPAQQAAAAATGVTPTLGGPAREVYSFSPAARPSGQAAAAAALPPGAIAAAPAAEEEDEVVSPEQAAARVGVTQPGTIPLSDSLADGLGSPASGAPVGAAAAEAVAPAAASPKAPAAPQQVAAMAAAGEPATEQQAQQQERGGSAELDDSDENAGLAALAAYEAHVASQQGSAQHHQQQPAPQPATAAGQGARPQQAAVQPQLAQQRAPPARVQLPQAADDDVVDLTADSPESLPTNRLPAGGAAGGGWAAGGAAAPADVVDLLDSSPTKRRHGDDAGQDAKRARPSPEARMPRPAAAIGQAPVPSSSDGAGPSAPAAAAAGGGGGAAQPLNVVSALSDAAPTCAICQELPVVTHAMVPCGHSFCGECLAEWLSKKAECPTCRKRGEAAPLRNHDMDRMIEMLVSLSAQGAGLLSAEDLEARKERMAAWESKKAELEGKLAAPWARGARGGGGGGGGAADGGAYGGMLSALAASILGGGGLGGFGMLGGDPLAGPGYVPAPPPAARQRRPPQIVPPRPAVPPPNEYRAEFTLAAATTRCAACNTGFGETATRIGQRPQAQARGPQAAYRWYHLGCLPASAWNEARARGVTNLRNLPPAHASRVPPVNTPSEGFWNATLIGDRCDWTLQANATLNGPIIVFLVPVGEGSAANPPPRLPSLPGLPASLPTVPQPAAGEMPPYGLPELHPPANGEVSYSGSFGAADLGGPAQGLSMQDLVAMFRAGQAWVNVHSVAEPAGVIRGQIHWD
ncbi:dynamin-related GTPase isoform A [Chlorella sorokiniana]|uniref:DNA ligase n=1 Tax=Chlorella sorokiniana TaxID=3076 RepID=A0A2P6TJ56_CHLSO|nr:dynamin-related GTPase isoform A [Chlorella sorokiniana]|eukprot:PRW39278.1 dynamin-related GTPase isoform A [Chlorella sorokiniana]